MDVDGNGFGRFRGTLLLHEQLHGDFVAGVTLPHAALVMSKK
jgi:hypothetical protein